jgi:hypothetical protein
MANYQKLNNVDHGDLRVIIERGARYGDDVMFCMTFPFEMRALQACYPIMLYKDPGSGELYPVAVFGFEQGENLFLEDSSWDAPRIPLMIQRQPFLIGFQGSTPGAERDRVVSIDVDHPRVSQSEGLRLFLEHGGNSDFLEDMANKLEAVHNGHEQNQAFVEALLKHDLVESVTLDITLKDGSRNQLQGMYMVDDEKLQMLDAAALDDLNRNSALLPAYMMVASQSQLGRLIERRNAKLPG